PPQTKLLTRLLQIRDQLRKPGVSRVTRIVCAELGDEAPRHVLPALLICIKSVPRGTGKDSPEHITCMRRRNAVEGKEIFSCSIVSKHIPASPQDVGGVRIKRLDYLLQGGTHLFLCRNFSHRYMLQGQQKEMLAFIRTQFERLGQALQHLLRGMNISSLLQRDIPGGSDIGKFRNFFTA